jgi:serine/threonine protein kinase
VPGQETDRGQTPPKPDDTWADTVHDPEGTGEWKPPKEEDDSTAVLEAHAAEDLQRTSPYPEAPRTRAKGWAGTQGGAGEATSGGDRPRGARRPADMPATLGGYQLVKQLGQGGMGTVYLARQISLDRNVALKVMNPLWASNPTFLARFTREAYAAAQLLHHNIVQIYDIGAEGDIHYFSMEFVQGQNLGDLLREHGRLDTEMAVGYILQAARGLKHAHDQSMVHRDIKPDNLMLNDQGIVKVADLGLVKTPNLAEAEEKLEEAGDAPAPAGQAGSNVTAVGVAMGTPAYMAPEQGRNAAAVDQRADIYSLGCTLYVLLTGRPPFEGKSALEVITKHFNEPIVRPETIVKRVPKEISDVLIKMLAKNPEERHANMGEVIADLEKFLGLQRAGPFTPREEHATLLEDSVKQYTEAPAGRRRSLIKLSYYGGCVVAALLLALVQMPLLAGAAVGLAVLTAVCSFLVTGLASRTHLFLKTRELVLSSSWGDWLIGVVAGLLILAALYMLGLLWVWLGVLIVALLVAVGMHVALERPLAAQRQPALAQAEDLLKKMRLSGLEEDAVRQFVCKYGGKHWEPLFEALFGYEMLLQARQQWTRGGGQRRPQHAAWRDPIILWIDNRQRALREAREKKHLQKVEEKGLQARGLNAAVARAAAAAAAEALVRQAAALKKEQVLAQKTEADLRATTASAQAEPSAPQPQLRAGALMKVGRFRPSDEPIKRRLVGPGLMRGLLRPLFGARARFLTGALLLGACLFWIYQNRNLQAWLKAAFGTLAFSRPLPPTLPATFGVLPGELAQLLFGSFNPGVAGVVLIASSGWESYKVVFLSYLGALVTLLGPLGCSLAGMELAVPVPVLGTLGPVTLSLAAGLGLVVLGLLWSRFTETS